MKENNNVKAKKKKKNTMTTNKKMGPKCELGPFYKTSALLIGFIRFEVVMFESWLP